jgi:hypothetical protein
MVQQCNEDSRSTGANGVTKCDGAAPNVNPSWIELQLPPYRYGLYGERLICFEEVDI